MSLLKRIINSGVDKTKRESVKERIITANIVSLILIFFLAGPYIPITIFTNPSLTWIPILGLLVGCFSITLNALGLNLFGRFLISMGPASLSGFYHAFIVPSADPSIIEFAFITFAFGLTPFVVFRIREYIGWIPSVLYSGIWVIGFTYLKDYFETPETLDSEFLREGIFKYMSGLMAFTYGGGAVFTLAYQNMVSERKARAATEEMATKQAEMAASQAELEKTLEEIEIKKLEEEKRMWANDGMVKFSELLRNTEGEEMYEKVISEMVQYIGARQGKFYQTNEDYSGNKTLNLMATYAYDRQKFEDEKIEIGEGLIGECYKEGEFMHITEVPDNYVTITSGLGKANPNAILIFPLLNEEKIEGIIELATFHKFHDYQIDFLNAVGINIATTISREKTKMQTNNLLEESKQQTEMMQQQEEEMRQNMEEMIATQEMMDSKEKELQDEIKKLKNLLGQG